MSGGSIAGVGPDRAARWALVWPHRDRLLAVARARVPCAEDAEDCVTEAMVRAVEHDDLDPARVGGFLCAVVVRLTADLHRDGARRRRASRRFAARDAVAAPFDDAVCERDEARWLAGRLDVRGRERQLVDERTAGHSVAEAAGHLGISAKAAENAWTRVRGKAERLLRGPSSRTP